MRKIYDPGTAHAAQIAEIEATARGGARTARPGSAMTPMTWTGSAWNTGGWGGNRSAEGALERKPGYARDTDRPDDRPGADNARRREMLTEFEIRVVLHRPASRISSQETGVGAAVAGSISGSAPARRPQRTIASRPGYSASYDSSSNRAATASSSGSSKSR
jgi:hypothetical protein